MVVNCAQGVFAKETSNVDGSTQDIPLTFTPKAVIVYSELSVTNNSLGAHYQYSIGFSDGTNHRARNVSSRDNVAATDADQKYRNDAVVIRVNDVANGGISAHASVTFSTNNIRFTWITSDATASLIHYIAFGGDDITNVKVANTTTGTNTTGTIDYTGLGFNPSGGSNSIGFFSTHSSNQLPTATAEAKGYMGMGVATSSSKRWSMYNLVEHTADPTDTWRYYSNAHCLTIATVTDGTIDGNADFSAWIPDGFRLNWTDAPSATDLQIFYMVINGGTWDCGTLTTPTTATNNVDYAVSVGGNTLRGMLMAATGTVTTGTIDAQAILSLGATNGTNQSVIATIDLDAVATTDSFKISNNAQIVKIIVTAGADSDVANFDSFTTNNFRLDWTTKSVSAQLVGWVVVADGAVAVAQPHSFGKIHTHFDNNLGPAIFG